MNDSTEAFETFSSDPSRFDLVITDQTMPGITGLNLAREILKIRPDIPVILCSGHSDAVTLDKLKEAGITEFLMKPLARKELAEDNLPGARQGDGKHETFVGEALVGAH